MAKADSGKANKEETDNQRSKGGNGNREEERKKKLQVAYFPGSLASPAYERRSVSPEPERSRLAKG